MYHDVFAILASISNHLVKTSSQGSSITNQQITPHLGKTFSNLNINVNLYTGNPQGIFQDLESTTSTACFNDADGSPLTRMKV